ncbi:hypothetical protein F5Y05DRAFT_418922 [Hypoxylon sp. FL0543]|nr:hypothetical protein F5Y05DRAFT_418922 [Hypoxylon sp. FL0543]
MTALNPRPYWTPSDPPGPDEQVPLLTGRRLEMFQALEEHDSYYELSLIFPSLADDVVELAKNIPGSNKAELEILADRHSNERAMFMLLHAIPKDLLKSLILGTVAFDFLSSTTPPKHYDSEGAGAYVAAMAIEGRNGKWLSRIDVRDLRKNLNKYIRAYLAWKTHRGNPSKPDHVELCAFARNVDNQFGSREASKPEDMRFINDDSIMKINSFIRSLDRRSDPSLPGSDLVYQISSPLYVGCAKNMKNRATVYQPESGLKQANKLWSLVCCMLGYMGKTPIVKVVPVVRIWNKADLPRAEILTTLLASSLVTQDGFNGHGLGTALDSDTVDALEESERYVLGHEPYLMQNIEASSQEMTRRMQLVENMDRLVEFPSSEFQTSLEALEEKDQQMESLVEEFDTIVADMRKETANLRQQKKDAEKYADYLRRVKEVFDILLDGVESDEEPDEEADEEPDEEPDEESTAGET